MVAAPVVRLAKTTIVAGKWERLRMRGGTLVTGLTIGICAGVAIGAAFGNVAGGIAIGAAVGLTLGVAFEKKGKDT